MVMTFLAYLLALFLFKSEARKCTFINTFYS